MIFFKFSFMEPANPVEIVEPTPVMVPESEDFPSFLVVIKKDKSVWYNEKTAENDTLLTRVAGPIKENLKKIIAAYKDKADKENIKPGYYIKGDNSLEYPQFKEILNAFKENDIFKYKLVTLLSPEDMLKTSSEPSTLNLFMPKDEQKEIQTKANDSGLTLLLLKNNILAYNGDKMFEAETYDYKTIHQLLMTQSKKYGKEFIVIIKPAEEAPYKATVDILDEMTICEIKRYAIVDLKPVEKEIIKKFNSVNGR